MLESTLASSDQAKHHETIIKAPRPIQVGPPDRDDNGRVTNAAIRAAKMPAHRRVRNRALLDGFPRESAWLVTKPRSPRPAANLETGKAKNATQQFWGQSYDGTQRAVELLRRLLARQVSRATKPFGASAGRRLSERGSGHNRATKEIVMTSMNRVDIHTDHKLWQSDVQTWHDDLAEWRKEQSVLLTDLEVVLGGPCPSLE